jgi:hypothetical protein
MASDLPAEEISALPFLLSETWPGVTFHNHSSSLASSQHLSPPSSPFENKTDLGGSLVERE